MTLPFFPEGTACSGPEDQEEFGKTDVPTGSPKRVEASALEPKTRRDTEDIRHLRGDRLVYRTDRLESVHGPSQSAPVASAFARHLGVVTNAGGEFVMVKRTGVQANPAPEPRLTPWPPRSSSESPDAKPSRAAMEILR
jgi:hypothetical protein